MNIIELKNVYIGYWQTANAKTYISYWHMNRFYFPSNISVGPMVVPLCNGVSFFFVIFFFALCLCVVCPTNEQMMILNRWEQDWATHNIRVKEKISVHVVYTSTDMRNLCRNHHCDFAIEEESKCSTKIDVMLWVVWWTVSISSSVCVCMSICVCVDLSAW